MDTGATIAISMAEVLPFLGIGIFVYGVSEFLYLHYRRRLARVGEYRMIGVSLGVLIAAFVASALVTPFNATMIALWGAGFAPFDVGLSPLGWVYGLVAYEFAYWLQHWLAHNVRLLWCLHSPHHAPNSMNMFVGFNHSFLESVFYMPFMLGALPAMLGVPPLMIAALSTVDVVWGNLLHISDGVVTRRYGVLERILQTPSYHRVHHAQNVQYMDTNYNSITLLWDWIMGTLEPLDDAEPVQFGITRDVDTSSFRDVHLGEFELLWKDVRGAPSWRAAISYLLQAPGWVPSGESNTSAARKARLLARQSGAAA